MVEVLGKEKLNLKERKMKAKFTLIGKNDYITKITVEMESPSYFLTKSEMREWKLKMQDEVHALLTRDKYHCAQIRQGK